MAQSGVRDNRAFMQFTLSEVMTYFQREFFTDGTFLTAGGRAIIIAGGSSGTIFPTRDRLINMSKTFGDRALCPPVGGVILVCVAS